MAFHFNLKSFQFHFKTHFDFISIQLAFEISILVKSDFNSIRSHFNSVQISFQIKSLQFKCQVCHTQYIYNINIIYIYKYNQTTEINVLNGTKSERRKETIIRTWICRAQTALSLAVILMCLPWFCVSPLDWK